MSHYTIRLMLSTFLSAFKVIENKLIRLYVRGKISHVAQMLLIDHVSLGTVSTFHFSTFMCIFLISFHCSPTIFTVPELFTHERNNDILHFSSTSPLLLVFYKTVSRSYRFITIRTWTPIPFLFTMISPTNITPLCTFMTILYFETLCHKHHNSKIYSAKH